MAIRLVLLSATAACLAHATAIATAREPGTRPSTRHADPPSPVEGAWEGEVVYGQFRRGFIVHLSRTGDRWSGAIAAPVWGSVEWPLGRVAIVGTQLVMEVGGAGAPPGVFDGAISERAVEGTYAWKGKSYHFSMTRDRNAQAHRPAQPQLPESPLPYETQPVSFKSGDERIAGGLVVPHSPGPHPAIVVVGGGEKTTWRVDIPGDWFPNLAGLVWTDQLARDGIVTLSTDARGVGGSTGRKEDATLSDLADDALAAVRFLRSREEVDRDQVGIFGISEGASVALMAAGRGENVRLLVRLSGLGIPGDEWKISQFRELTHAMGDEDRNPPDEFIAMERELFSLCKTNATVSEIRERMKRWAAEQRKPNREAGAPGHHLPAETPEEVLLYASTPLMRSSLRYDPRPDLRRISVPVLDVHGAKDVVAVADQSVPEIEAALTEGQTKDATVWTLPGLDHWMHKSETGFSLEDSMGEEVVDHHALHDVIDWIGEHMPSRDRTK